MTIPISKTGYCLYCGEKHEHYGEVDTPPIVQQIYDNKNHIKREWLSHRHFCPTHSKLYDVVIINKVQA